MNGRQPTVALIVDHPQRDLAGIVLTAFTLCQQGVVCHLVPHNLEEQELWALAPDLALLNFFRPVNQELARRLMAAGIQVGVLDTEGGVWPNEAAYAELLMPDADVRRQLACVCMWGPRLAHHMVEQGILSPEQITVTGCPRFDFYHRRWQGVLPGSGDGAAKRILINTNFSTANPRFATVAQNVHQARDAFGLPAARVAAMMEAEGQGVEAMIDLALRLARDFPDAEIVFRPHPFESPEPYRRRLRDGGRIVVENDGPVQPEISRSAVVIQRSCSTAVEAGLAGVPTLSPLWVPAPVVNPMSERVSVPCESYGELRGRLDAILSGGYEVPEGIREAIEGVTSDWFYRSDGLAHRRVSETVLRQLGRGPTVDEERCRQGLYGPQGLGRALRYGLRLPPDWSFRRMRRVATENKPGKSFGVAQVMALTEAIRQRAADGAARPVTVTAARDEARYRRRLLLHTITLTCQAQSSALSARQAI